MLLSVTYCLIFLNAFVMCCNPFSPRGQINEYYYTTRSGTQYCPWSCRASSGASRLQVHPWQPLHFSWTPWWNDKKKIWELWNNETKSSVWCPIQAPERIHVLSRGTSEVLTQGDKLLVRWKDNNVVTVATNMEEKYSETFVKRWNKERRTFD